MQAYPSDVFQVDIRHNKNSYVVAPTLNLKTQRIQDSTRLYYKKNANELEKWILKNLYTTNKEEIRKEKQEKRICEENGITKRCK